MRCVLVVRLVTTKHFQSARAMHFEDGQASGIPRLCACLAACKERKQAPVNNPARPASSPPPHNPLNRPLIKTVGRLRQICATTCPDMRARKRTLTTSSTRSPCRAHTRQCSDLAYSSLTGRINRYRSNAPLNTCPSTSHCRQVRRRHGPRHLE